MSRNLLYGWESGIVIERVFDDHDFGIDDPIELIREGLACLAAEDRSTGRRVCCRTI